MRDLSLHPALKIKRVNERLPWITTITPPRSHTLSAAIGVKIPGLIARQIATGMKQIEPESENQHGSKLEGKKIPFVAEDWATVLGAAEITEHFERLDCAENAA